MNKKIIIIGVIVLVAAYFFFMSGPSSQYVNTMNPDTNTAATTTKTTPITTTKPKVVSNQTTSTHVYVDILATAFSPKALTIKAGTTVTWTNRDTAPHGVVADNGGPTSNLLPKGQSYSYKYTVKGIFGYHDSANATTTGTIIVN